MFGPLNLFFRSSSFIADALPKESSKRATMDVEVPIAHEGTETGKAVLVRLQVDRSGQQVKVGIHAIADLAKETVRTFRAVHVMHFAAWPDGQYRESCCISPIHEHQSAADDEHARTRSLRCDGQFRKVAEPDVQPLSVACSLV